MFQLCVLQEHLTCVCHVATDVAFEECGFMQQLMPSQVTQTDRFEITLSAAVNLHLSGLVKLCVLSEMALSF